MVYFAPSTTPYLPEKIIQQIEYIEGFATKQSNEEDISFREEMETLPVANNFTSFSWIKDSTFDSTLNISQQLNNSIENEIKDCKKFQRYLEQVLSEGHLA